MNNIKFKIFGDNIHGQIKIHPLLVRIIDTPQFQRLRHLKQLGSVSFVYPTANHTRFEHCIGTSYICDFFMKHLKENQPELKITLQDELCVRIAGLCHDLGHGPFSHMFEEVLGKICPDTKWTHEQASLKLFDKMLIDTPNLKTDFELYGLLDDDIKLIKDLIHNDTFKDPLMSYEEKLNSLDSLKKKGFDKSFLFEIVSNNRNGIDVDKFDYFERDSKNLGISNNFDFKRYIQGSRVIPYKFQMKDSNIKTEFTQICCRDKMFPDLYEMYQVRERLTRKAYKHEKCLSINTMMVEALKLASDHFKFEDIVKGMRSGEFLETNETLNKYEKLNDSIYLQILNSEDDELKLSRDIEKRVKKRKLNESIYHDILKTVGTEEQKITQAKKILERIEKRKLYKYLGKCVLKENFDIQSFLKGKEMDKKIYHVEHVKFNWGSKNLNPLEKVNCYNKNKPNEFKKIQGGDVSNMLPKKFQEEVLYIYLKQEDYDPILNDSIKSYLKTKGLILLHGVDGFSE